MQKLAGRQLALVSDVISPYGLKDGRYKWDKRDICSEEGSCRLEDGTLAGSTFPLLEGCRKLAQWGLKPSASIWAATMAPRVVLESNTSIVKNLNGKNLKNLLRWTEKNNSSELVWRHAA